VEKSKAKNVKAHQRKLEEANERIGTLHLALQQEDGKCKSLHSTVSKLVDFAKKTVNSSEQVIKIERNLTMKLKKYWHFCAQPPSNYYYYYSRRRPGTQCCSCAISSTKNAAFMPAHQVMPQEETDAASALCGLGGA